MSAERAERDVLHQEAEATAAAHRQAFDDMVAAARAAPDTAPHDPMRFRAVPPGWCKQSKLGSGCAVCIQLTVAGAQPSCVRAVSRVQHAAVSSNLRGAGAGMVDQGCLCTDKTRLLCVSSLLL